MSEINHNEAARLLPWLVNGTLAGTERERVERHVRDCLVCRAEVREQQALQVLVRQRADVPLSAEQGFEALAQRLQEAREGGRFARPRRDASGARRFNFALVRLLGGEGFQPRLAAVAGMAVVAVGLLLWLGLRAPDGQEGAYRTLSAQQAAGGAELDIVFSPAVTQEGMREVLGSVGATIVNGPSAIGRYTIRLAPAGSSGAEVDAALRKLRADQRVRFAARSYIPGTRGAQDAHSGSAPAKDIGHE